jgi:uncharacterized membrane protein
MSQAKEQTGVGVIAVYPDCESVERALRRLDHDGINMGDVSVIARDSKLTEVPAGPARKGDLAMASAEVGAVAGCIFGLLLGTAFLVVPGLGPVVVAGSFAAALAGAAEGAFVGAVIGGLGGVFVKWGIPDVHVQKYEMLINNGKFLVLARVDSADVEHTRSLLEPEALGHIDVYERYNK